MPDMAVRVARNESLKIDGVGPAVHFIEGYGGEDLFTESLCGIEELMVGP